MQRRDVLYRRSSNHKTLDLMTLGWLRTRKEIWANAHETRHSIGL